MTPDDREHVGGGAQTVGLDQAISFDGVRETVEAIGLSLTRAFERAKPNEATAEFGLGVTAKAGKLTGLLVDGEGTASLKVTLIWKRSLQSG